MSAPSNRRLTDLSKIRNHEIYTVEELAPLLKVNPRTLRRYCADGIFENAVTIGGRQWRIPGVDVLARLPFLCDQDNAG